MATPTAHELFGELRSLEHAAITPETFTRLSGAFATLHERASALGALPDALALGARVSALYTRLVSFALERRGWVRQADGLYTLSPNEHATLVAALKPATSSLLIVCPPERGGHELRFVELLGRAHGLAQTLGMLTCIALEFTGGRSSLRQPGGLPDDVVSGELERRRAWVGSLDPELFDLPRLMSKVCGHDDYIAWANLNGLDPRRHDPGGEVTSFLDWQGAHAVYTPALSTHGSFGDDCSEIWVAHDLTFPTHDAARDWASTHAGRAPAYYRLSAQWRHVCTGKQWGKYT